MKKVFLMIANLILISSFILSNIKTSIQGKIKYNQLYVLGDSLSDVGAMVFVVNIIFGIFLLSEFKLPDPCYQNRSFSNGKIASEILAEKLNLTLKPAWSFVVKDQKFKQEGNNYAFAGSAALEIKCPSFIEKILNYFVINKQVDALLEQHKIKDNDLIFFETGSNDLMFQVMKCSSLQEQELIITNMISNQNKALKKLIDNGCKHIIVMNAPDLGKVPRYKSFGEEYQEKVSNVSKYYNNLWLNMINNLRKDYPKYIKILDVYDLFSKLLNDFSKKKNIDQGAIEYSLNYNVIMENIKPKYNLSVSKSINDYFFFDFVHPTESIHASIGEVLYQLASEKW